MCQTKLYVIHWPLVALKIALVVDNCGNIQWLKGLLITYKHKEHEFTLFTKRVVCRFRTASKSLSL